MARRWDLCCGFISHELNHVKENNKESIGLLFKVGHPLGVNGWVRLGSDQRVRKKYVLAIFLDPILGSPGTPLLG